MASRGKREETIMDRISRFTRCALSSERAQHCDTMPMPNGELVTLDGAVMAAYNNSLESFYIEIKHQLFTLSQET